MPGEQIERLVQGDPMPASAAHTLYILAAISTRGRVHAHSAGAGVPLVLAPTMDAGALPLAGDHGVSRSISMGSDIVADNDNSANALIEIAAELTVAWLSNPNTRAVAEDVAPALRAMHAALASLASSFSRSETSQVFVPAVSVQESLASKDHIISMIDGKPLKALSRHLRNHGLTPDEYRQRYGLQSDYPMVAENYSRLRRALALKIGLGRSRHSATSPTEPPSRS
jgi:predicted transcriptional regulator